ncbi:murein biosynthesis integral membrane protein MurJ [Ectothiorhodospira mobilis]|uniref:murein biosynthesis integral membrane protein MurJ n=1 Tax=Ectothiorhodospira mobilis TaxID=195064 RepID=UPI001EE8F23D|nr:murein biosynthesis integral membrane protein MurJ [Ectothiorhodospira mobilis]MCG5534774.1 murein biosynthesis integral membrane protein MurJ [Ectothiorhodospira mobilis]
MSRLLRSTAIVSAMTLVSRLFGYVRDMVLAVTFGASGATDAFFVAFRIPNFLRRLFAEGAFSQAFVPVFAEYRQRHGRAALQDLLDHVSGTLTVVLLLTTAAGILAAPWLIHLFAPGFGGDTGQHALAAQMLRITFPYLLFISLTAMAGGILNSVGRFAVPAFTPVLLNLALIGAALLAAPHFDEPVVALAWGVFIAGAAQLLFQVPFLVRQGLLPRPRLRRGHEGVSRIIRLMLPALLGTSVVQVNLLVDTLIASFLATGSISWLYFSDRFVELPLALFGIAIGTVILPRLSGEHSARDPAAFTRTLDWALRLSVLIALPAALGLVLLATPILAALIQYREFLATDTAMAALSLMAYALGLPAFILIKVLAPGYFARQDTRTPVQVAVIAMLANMVLNLALVVPWVLLDWPGPHAGLALATSLSAYLNAALLYRGLRHTGIFSPLPGWTGLGLRILPALAVMATVLWSLTPAAAQWTQWEAPLRVAALLGLVAAGAAAYGGMLLAAGVRPRQLLLH